MEKTISKLKNGIDFFYKRNLDTPRAALCLNFALPDFGFAPGVTSLMVRLLFKGTKTRSAEVIADEFDKNGIDFTVETKQDYLRFRFLCLNEDFEKAVELVTDLIKNSTFECFDTEVAKLQGEIVAELDSPRGKVIDNYCKHLFENHYYGYTNTKILENLENITKEQVISAYQNIFNNGKKVLSFVGDIEFNTVEGLVNNSFGDLPAGNEKNNCNAPEILNEHKYLEIIKPDANQAHIVKGWRVGAFDSEDYPALNLLNVILGASGLSSRLFLELRDKKGLAYVVRSSYDVSALGASFSIYIATEPKNIEVSLKGFEEEIEKIKNVLVSEEELENAKNNILGKWAFSFETNAQQACNFAHYGILNLGIDFNEKVKEKIKLVTAEQVKACANKYFNDKFVTSILKP